MREGNKDICEKVNQLSHRTVRTSNVLGFYFPYWTRQGQRTSQPIRKKKNRRRLTSSECCVGMGRVKLSLQMPLFPQSYAHKSKRVEEHFIT